MGVVLLTPEEGPLTQSEITEPGDGLVVTLDDLPGEVLDGDHTDTLILIVHDEQVSFIGHEQFRKACLDGVRIASHDELVPPGTDIANIRVCRIQVKARNFSNKIPLGHRANNLVILIRYRKTSNIECGQMRDQVLGGRIFGDLVVDRLETTRLKDGTGRHG